MFTGLVKEIGRVRRISKNAEGAVLEIQCQKLLSDISVDDSVAINGVCQTAIAVGMQSFTVQAVHTTLQKTTLGSLKMGDEVNLELALRLSDRLGGHLVQGHVNAVAPITAIKAQGDNYLVSLHLPTNQLAYVIKEGSITLDGISLTIAELEQQSVTVSIIPHTFHSTILKNKKVGDFINIEVDVLAKYIERLLKFSPNDSGTASSQMTEEWLRSKGF